MTSADEQRNMPQCDQTDKRKVMLKDGRTIFVTMEQLESVSSTLELVKKRGGGQAIVFNENNGKPIFVAHDDFFRLIPVKVLAGEEVFEMTEYNLRRMIRDTTCDGVSASNEIEGEAIPIKDQENLKYQFFLHGISLGSIRSESFLKQQTTKRGDE